MATIRELLERHAPGRFTNKGLGWGAKVSDYRDEIAAALGRGETPVLIELTDDLPAGDLPVEAFARDRCVIVDHHGPLAGADRPTALEQVFRLLCLPKAAWTRTLALIAANDKGHIAAMQALGAGDAEIRAIRARDRAAQGVSAAEEAAAMAAIAARRAAGRLTRVAAPHDRATAVADLMEPALGGPGYAALLVEMPTELAFFGDGDTVAWLAAAAPGSWWGAALPAGAPREALIASVLARLAT